MLEPYYNVKEIFMHPEFHPQGLYKDIALVHLKESVPFKVVPGFAPLRLPKHTPTGEWPPHGSNCTAIGWGCGNLHGPVRDQQHAVDLTKIPHSLCSEIYRDKRLSPFKLCAGFVRQGKGLCHGDSGGPLVCPSVDGKEILAGVAISGNRNGPSIFTGVSHFRTWIDSVLRYHHILE
ncbi:hypothetical protein CRM22_001947 [Opisthorchis felineus]|uniref:Peptidase S1 domain-containing protein n=1 Tax=Opisthorchis felineus TaxID=147828 RepID=A0A4S2M8A2_OPIFE|nr:hypothetical protein CRM22_001947 [Opisthorchis felineus]